MQKYGNLKMLFLIFDDKVFSIVETKKNSVDSILYWKYICVKNVFKCNMRIYAGSCFVSGIIKEVNKTII